MELLTLGSDDELRIIDPYKFYVLKDIRFTDYYVAYSCELGYCMAKLKRKYLSCHQYNIERIDSVDCENYVLKHFIWRTLQETVASAVRFAHDTQHYHWYQVAQFDNPGEFFLCDTW